MDGLEKAKDILEKTNCSVVIICGGDTYTSDKKGIMPLIEFISCGTDFTGAHIADKIVGKAAAMLFSIMNIGEVYGTVMSRSAVEFLKSRNIRYSYGTLCDSIINRKGDGICPMEQTVADIEDEQQAYCALKNKIKQMQNQNK